MGFNGGGGGGARFVAAADEAADATLEVAEYGGGASDTELDGGGGAVFLKDEAEEIDRAGAGAALKAGLVDPNAELEVWRPKVWFCARLCCTSRAAMVCKLVVCARW